MSTFPNPGYRVCRESPVGGKRRNRNDSPVGNHASIYRLVCAELAADGRMDSISCDDQVGSCEAVVLEMDDDRIAVFANTCASLVGVQSGGFP